jgi:hypothetical protein
LGTLAQARLAVGGFAILTNAGPAMTGRLYIFAGATNVLDRPGALVSIAGDLRIASNAWYFPVSHPTNGGSARLVSANVTIAPGGGVNADAVGFRSYPAVNYGPGTGGSSGSRGSGAGYGGWGGRCTTIGTGGPPYGETNRPVHPGSAGGFGYTPGPGYGHGGGLIWIETGDMVLDGTLSANGRNAVGSYGGAGSGGGIFVLANTFSGIAEGMARANGGTANTNLAGGGSGGRIAIAVGMTPALRAKLIAGEEVEGLFTYATHGAYAGCLSVTNGIGYGNGEPGSATFLTSMAGKFSLDVRGDPGNFDTPAPYFYGVAIGIEADTMITNTVTTPADEAGGVRRACIGWTLANDLGVPIASGSSTQAVFPLATNMTLTFRWTNEYLLTALPGPNGTVNVEVVNGWYTNGLTAAGITAAADPGYRFQDWAGDVPLADATNNPLSLAMDRPRTVLAQFVSLSGGLKTWNGVGAWENPANWSPPGAPGPLDDAVIASGNVLLSQTRQVRSLLVSNNATITFTNWTTALAVSNDVLIRSGGTLALPPAFRHPTDPASRIWVLCRNFTLETNAQVNAAARGYYTHTGPGKGVGFGSNDGSGGGHGGRGGNSNTYPGGAPYGMTNAPQTPGSGGGGGYTDTGGHGGGVVWIDATGEVAIHGVITADGESGVTYNGGGAGGSIFIISQTFRGDPTGSVTARGGARGTGYPTILGGGGGGRIAVWHGDRSETDRAALLTGQYVKSVVITASHPPFQGLISAEPGLHNAIYAGPDAGSVVFLRKFQLGTVLTVR